jgi:hypothetical protein
VSVQIAFGTTAGTFTDTSTNAEGAQVPDTYTFTSTIDPSIGTVNSDGTATFTTVAGTFDVTATDPAGLSGTETFEYLADLVPVAVGTPTFTAA